MLRHKYLQRANICPEANLVYRRDDAVDHLVLERFKYNCLVRDDVLGKSRVALQHARADTHDVDDRYNVAVAPRASALYFVVQPLHQEILDLRAKELRMQVDCVCELLEVEHLVAGAQRRKREENQASLEHMV